MPLKMVSQAVGKLVQFLPEDDASVNDSGYEIFQVLRTLASQVPNLTDDPASAGTLHALDERRCASVLYNDIDTDTIGQFQDFFMPGTFGVVDGQ